MSTHTPGPWVWRWKSGTLHRAGDRPDTCGATVIDVSYEYDSGTTTDVTDADAALIAAAPDMHAALSDLAQVFLARPDILGLCGPHEHALIRAACDALNKAAGAAP